jgi:SH3 domain-containing protein
MEGKNFGYIAINSLKNSIKGHKRVTFSLISVIFVFLLGLWVFNNKMEFRRIETSLKLETVPSKETSKGVEVGGEVTKETKKEESAQEKIKKTPETQSTKTEGEKKKIQQLSSQKKLLTVIALSANIRGGPGRTYPIFSVVKEGDILEGVNGENGNWIKVKTRDGVVGWISKELVREIDSQYYKDALFPSSFSIQSTLSRSPLREPISASL